MDSGRKRNRAAARPGVYHMFHSALRVGLGTPAFHSSLGDVLAMSSLPQAAFGGFDTHRFVDAISTASRAATAGFDTHRFADIISTASRAATAGLDTRAISRAATAGFDTHRFADIISTASRAATTGLDTRAISRAATAGFDTHRFADIISTASRAVLGGVAHDLAQSIENQLITTAANEDVETWWTALPLQVRVAVVVTVVWVCVFLTATTWSMEDPAISKYLQDHTQIGPLTLATAASWAARVVYRRTSGSE